MQLRPVHEPGQRFWTGELSSRASNYEMWPFEITEIRNLEPESAAAASLALTPAAGDPIADVRRTIPKFDPRVLATREELDCLPIHDSNSLEIQNQPAPCRFPAQQALQLGHCLSVDPATHEDPSPRRGSPDLEHVGSVREQRSCQRLHS
jgi:hypothetical protein